MNRHLLPTVCIALALAGAAQAQIPGDANNDGKLSPAEFATGGAALMMAGLDANKDGRITREEFNARRAGLRHPGVGAAFDLPSSIVPLDQNRDGSVTRAELEAMLAKRFRRVDIDGDGYLSPSELK